MSGPSGAGGWASAGMAASIAPPPSPGTPKPAETTRETGGNDTRDRRKVHILWTTRTSPTGPGCPTTASAGPGAPPRGPGGATTGPGRSSWSPWSSPGSRTSSPRGPRWRRLSKSATKAPRAGIGREEKPGISTFLFRRSGAIGAFVADLDNLRRRGPLGGGGRRSVGGRPTVSLRPRGAQTTGCIESNVVSAGFGDEGDEGGEGGEGGGVRPAGSGQASRPRGPPSSRGSTSGFPRPVRRSLLRRDDGRGLPCTHGRLGDGTGHRAPQPWRHPRPAVSHMQPAGPGGSPGGRLGESREMRCTRATADGPRDGTVTRRGPGPGSGRAGATTALPAAPAFRPDPDRIPRAPTCPTGLGSLRIRGRPRRNAPPRAPAGLGPRSSGPPGASESGPARLRPRGPVTGSCPAAP